MFFASYVMYLLFCMCLWVFMAIQGFFESHISGEELENFYTEMFYWTIETCYWKSNVLKLFFSSGIYKDQKFGYAFLLHFN